MTSEFDEHCPPFLPEPISTQHWRRTIPIRNIRTGTPLLQDSQRLIPNRTDQIRPGSLRLCQQPWPIRNSGKCPLQSVLSIRLISSNGDRKPNNRWAVRSNKAVSARSGCCVRRPTQTRTEPESQRGPKCSRHCQKSGETAVCLPDLEILRLDGIFPPRKIQVRGNSRIVAFARRDAQYPSPRACEFAQSIRHPRAAGSHPKRSFSAERLFCV